MWNLKKKIKLLETVKEWLSGYREKGEAIKRVQTSSYKMGEVCGFNITW